MSKIDRIKKSIAAHRAGGKESSKIVMGRSFAVALKNETIADGVNKYFVNGRMEILGVPWEIDRTMKGFRIE